MFLHCKVYYLYKKHNFYVKTVLYFIFGIKSSIPVDFNAYFERFYAEFPPLSDNKSSRRIDKKSRCVKLYNFTNLTFITSYLFSDNP